MSLSIREQIVVELQTRLTRLLAAGQCLRCEPYDDSDEFVAIWDIDEENTTSSYNRTDRELQIAVVYTLMYKGDDSPVKLNAMLAELEYQVYRNSADQFDDEINGLAENLECTASAMKFRQSGSEHISVGATFRVKYATKRGDPYSQP